MTEAELVIVKKKKTKNNKQLLLEEVPEPANPPEMTTTEVDSHKKHKHKKKKKRRSENDDCRPVEIQCDTREGQNKKKRKHNAENLSVTPEAEDVTAAKEREVKKKKKKRRIEEPDPPGEKTEAEVALTAVQTNTQPATDKHSPTDTKLHPDHVPEAPVLDLDDAIRQEIQEFLPHYIFGEAIAVQKVIKYDLPRFREFKKQGIPLRSGRFSATENKRLKQNVEDFLAVSGIDSEFKLFRPKRFPDQKDAILSLRKKFSFISSLCAGIARSWMTILARARKFGNRENYLGRYTEDENKTLKKLHTLHGSSWAIISEKMGRSPASVEKRFAMMAENHGPWTEAERKVLMACVHQQLLKKAKPGGEGGDGSPVIEKRDLYKKLGWTSVAEQVQTRTWMQCREKWMLYLTKKMTTGGKIRGRKSLEGQIQLIKAINEMAVDDPVHIVWDDLTHLFGNTPPDYLQMQFHKLKVTYVPNWHRKDFCDIVDFLYEKTLPMLEKNLKDCKDAEEPSEPRETYKLSEIFPDL